MDRNFVLDVELINCDEFLDMPKDAQLLYFNLLVNQSENGNVYNAKAIQRALRVDKDSLEVLAEKGFIVATDDIAGYTIITSLYGSFD